MTAEMDDPTGLEMHPRPPAAVRVRKGLGVAALIACGIFVLLIVFGIYERQRRQTQASFIADAERRATPATDAGHEFTSKIPPSEVPVLEQHEPSREDQAKVRPGDPAPSSQKPTTGPSRMRAVTASSPVLHNGPERTEDRERELAYQKEQEAIEAPTRIGGGGRSYGGDTNIASANSLPLSTNPPQQTFPGSGSGTNSARASSGDLRGGFAGMGQAAEYNAQNGQDDKAGFIAQARNRAPQNYLPSVRTAPLSKFEIKAGWEIPATLEQAINSDQPGEIKALVRENVYDTATGKYLLLPQGARLIGSYNSVVSYGQDGVQAVWDRVIFPDASSLNLNGMIGQDARGESGLRDSVDHHYTRLIGFAVLTSLFSAGFQLSQNRSGSVLAVPNTGEVVAGAVGSQLSQLGMEITRRNLNVQPTIKVPVGYRFNVRVNRDIVFDAPYSPRP